MLLSHFFIPSNPTWSLFNNNEKRLGLALKNPQRHFITEIFDFRFKIWSQTEWFSCSEFSRTKQRSFMGKIFTSKRGKTISQTLLTNFYIYIYYFPLKLVFYQKSSKECQNTGFKTKNTQIKSNLVVLLWQCAADVLSAVVTHGWGNYFATERRKASWQTSNWKDVFQICCDPWGSNSSRMCSGFHLVRQWSNKAHQVVLCVYIIQWNYSICVCLHSQ